MYMDEMRPFSMDDPDVALFVGYGNTPTNSVLWDTAKMVIIVAIINIKTDIIVDASINMATKMSENYIVRGLIGKNILTDSDKVLEGLSRYHAPAQKSLIVAYKALINRYMVFQGNNKRNSLQ